MARREIRQRLGASIRQLWLLLLCLAVLPPLAALAFAAITRGVFRWILFGASVTAGLGLAAGLLLLLSGVASRAMGTVAEQWTATDLRRLRKRGWRVVTGLTLPGQQIDHVAVGPPGVLVLETKWSGEAWLGDYRKPFMRARLEDAVAQANQSRFHLRSRLRHLVDDGDVHSVLVLWSAAGPTGDHDHPPEIVKETTVLLGPNLAGWLDSFDETHAARIDAEAVWTEVDRLASAGDARDAEKGLAPRSGLVSIYARTVVAPFSAAAVAILSFTISVRLGWTAGPWVETAASVALGILGSRVPPLRLASIVWTTVAIGVAVIVGLEVVVH